MDLPPDGPLHPTLALTALGGGAAITLLRGRSRWARAACGAWALAALAIVDTSPLDTWDVLTHPLRVQLVGAVAVGVLCGWLTARRQHGSSSFAVLAAVAVAWATVPDTEWPLAVGAALVPISLREVVATRHRAHTWVFGVCGGLAGAAAAIGARGRPERMWYPLLVLLAITGFAEWRRSH